MSRRVVVWLLALPLAVVGSQVGHALAYRVVTPDADARAHELAESGHAYLAYAPLALAVCTVLVLLALCVELRHAVTGAGAVRPSRGMFAVLAPGIFVVQEHFERLLHDGVFPWDAVVAPTFVAGLVLQVPFAVAAYGLARLLLRVVGSVGRLLSRPPRPLFAAVERSRPVGVVSALRAPALALGYGSRGPPLSLS